MGHNDECTHHSVAVMKTLCACWLKVQCSTVCCYFYYCIIIICAVLFLSCFSVFGSV